MLDAASGKSSIQRCFTALDQENFAALSGDYNPMHMDALAARRTQAGACVVHGMQALLWALEAVATQLPLARLADLEADFAQFLYLDETVALTVAQATPQEARLELRVGETRIAQYRLHFGGRAAADGLDAPAAAHYPAAARTPLAPDWAAMAQASGSVAFYRPVSAAAAAYPDLCRAISAPRVAGLLALTRLVGMVSPGLHSIFHRIQLQFTEDSGAGDALLHYATREAQALGSVVRMEVVAPGLRGSIKASRRAEPVRQPSSRQLQARAGTQRFTGHRALVIGGSRGLGELTAKLLGLAGVETIITYAQGQAEAEAVVADIRQCGGTARIMALDLRGDPCHALSALACPPSSLYFFATPRISGRAGGVYSPERYREFSRFYVDAFHEVCAALSRTATHRLQIFYPSSVFVSEPVKQMSEYAMAKAAGEVLAQQMNRFLPRLDIECVRLPRMATDQTAGIARQDLPDAADEMAPIIHRIEQRVAAQRAT